MTVETMAAPSSASRADVTPKAVRTAAFLEEHHRRMANPALRRWECRACKGLINKYRAPIGLVEEQCRKCGTMNELTTEPISAP